MFRKTVFAWTCAALLATAAFAETAQYGTAEDARAMLQKAVAAVKADKKKALEMFNSGEGGFKDRDLYVFCANASDAITTAHPTDPTQKGNKLTDMKDVNGVPFGEKIIQNATEGTISKVSYMWPRPGSETPAQKATFFTKVGDQICAVGYYK
jgi:signal transduction histidine kinase